MSPAIEMNEAADIQSAPMAIPLATAGIPRLATYSPSVVDTRVRHAM